MKSAGGLRQIAGVFVLAVAAYALFYSCIEEQRARKGPWQVVFETEDGKPVIVVSQPALRIQGVRVVFPSEDAGGNVAQRLSFDQAREVPFGVPFGKCVFQDAQTLPGTVTFELFGHEIQLLPRVLTIDGVEHPWRSGETIALPKLPGQRN